MSWGGTFTRRLTRVAQHAHTLPNLGCNERTTQKATRHHQHVTGLLRRGLLAASSAKELQCVISEDEKDAFRAMYTVLEDEALMELQKYNADAMTREWVREVTRYTVPGGKMNRGLHVIQTLKALQGRNSLSTDDFEKAAALGWCIEWLQACFLVADDVMDRSSTRRGNTCWYKREGVGLIAVNDSIILQSEVYKILRRRFRHEPYYEEVVDLFHETTHKTLIGQNLDLIIAAPVTNVHLDTFSMAKCRQIARYKTAFYSFHLPVAVAMRLHGIKDPNIFSSVEAILVDLGEFFQIQDDYLDCYGDPAVIGKIGTDIEDNKCSWLINQALILCTQEQKEVLQRNYGQRDSANVLAVKRVYDDVGLKQVFREYEERSYTELMSRIEKFQGPFPRSIFASFVDKIYKRHK